MRKLLSVGATTLAAFTIGALMPTERAQAETATCGADGEDCAIYCPSTSGFWNGSYIETFSFSGDCQYGYQNKVVCEFEGGHMRSFNCNV